MECFKKKWVSIALLSVVIPVSLLVSFRLTGILREPLSPEITQVETVNWKITRPSQDDETIFHIVRNIYRDDATLIELNVTLCKYVENGNYWPFEGNDGFHMGLTATANLNNDFVHSVDIRFYNDDNDASLVIHKDADALRLHNVELKDIDDLEPVSSIIALGINQPSNFELEIFPLWVFYDQNSIDHQMTVTLKVVYYNGTAYRETVIPIQLEVTLS